MSLSSALDASRSALSAFGQQTGVLSRNINNASNPDATRKIVNLVTSPDGGSTVGRTTRAVDVSLFNASLSSTSKFQESSTVLDALDRLDTLINDPELGRSPAALIGKLRDSLATFASQPDNTVLASSAISSALSLSGALNSMSSQVQSIRMEADASLAQSAALMNTNLADLHQLNSQIVTGTQLGTDVTDLLDQRDVILKQFSQEMGISWSIKKDNDINIYTESGVTLYDRVPREVSFQQSNLLTASTPGQQLYVDGVQVTGPGSPMPITTGRIAGLIEVRDEVTQGFQSQLDEIARGLIEAFAESDQSAVPALADQAGLFTWPGGPGVPASATVSVGIASTISVNATLQTGAGDAARLLRDGSISDPGNPAFEYNTSGFAGFSDRLDQMVEEIEGARSFDLAAGLDGNSGLLSFAADSASWLGGLRADMSRDAEFHNITAIRANEALSNATGVNLDEEIAQMLQLERSYQASTKLISVVDELLGYLITSIR
ncbi:MAG: flagellar hook-associated protein FlgK [Anderseniella sp.]